MKPLPHGHISSSAQCRGAIISLRWIAHNTFKPYYHCHPGWYTSPHTIQVILLDTIPNLGRASVKYDPLVTGHAVDLDSTTKSAHNFTTTQDIKT
jgi:hypothetical protein